MPQHIVTGLRRLIEVIPDACVIRCAGVGGGRQNAGVDGGTAQRVAESSAVTDLLARAQAGPAALVVEGEAGIGKTTLMLGAVTEAQTRGFRVLSAQGSPAEVTYAYAAVADLLRDVDSEMLAALPKLQRIALDTFEWLGAPLWAARARAELDRLDSPRGDGQGLTAAERRTAELAAVGRSNKEIAAELFISEKTVEMYLSAAYRKLGVRSRAGLSTALDR